jgi:ribokinase
MAFIQVNKDGENCILLNKGANYQFTVEQLIEILNNFDEGDVLLLQNEINLLDSLIDMALLRHLKIALNPSPFTDSILKLPLDKLSYLFINEVEGEGITGVSDPHQILSIMHEKFPACTVVLTLGSQGAMILDKGKILSHSVVKVEPVDTTAAGDVFTGYFLSTVTSGKSVSKALKIASYAAALSVTKKGAMDSIPTLQEVTDFMQNSKA